MSILVTNRGQVSTNITPFARLGNNGADEIPRQNLALWLRADRGVVLDTTSTPTVSQWLDQSGNGRHATQGTKTSQPTRVSNKFGQMGGLYFQNNFLNVDLTYLANNYYTLFVVEYLEVEGEARYFLGNNTFGANEALHIGHRSGAYITFAQFGNDLDHVPVVGMLNSISIWAFSFNSRGHEIWRNNSLVTSNTNTQGLTSSRDGVIGGALQRADYVGYLSMVIAYTGDMTTTTITRVTSVVNKLVQAY